MSLRVLVATNLIGDSLYLLGPVKKCLENNTVACIVVEAGLAGQLFVRSFGKQIPILLDEAEARKLYPTSEWVYLQAGLAANISLSHARKYGRHLHISEAYARMLDIDIEGKVEPILDWCYFSGQRFDTERKIAILSPFSRSCTRHGGMRPNKTFDSWKWEPIIRFLRRHEYEVKVSCRPNDRLEQCSIPESDYLPSYTLEEIEKDFRSASLTISVDNGLAHISSAVGTRTIIFWPPTLCAEFIAPTWSPKTTLIYMGWPDETFPVGMLVGDKKDATVARDRKDAKMKHHKHKLKKPKVSTKLYFEKRGLKVTRAKDVDRFLKKIAEKSIPVDYILNKYLKRYHIKGTNNEDYWRLKGSMILTGKETL